MPGTGPVGREYQRHNFDAIDDDCARALWFTDETRRVLARLFLLGAAALLIHFFW